jgi:invasion protein IalB
MASRRILAGLAPSTAFAATILIVLDLPHLCAQQPVPNGQHDDQFASQPQIGGLQLIFSPWAKYCLPRRESYANQVCFIGKDGRGVSDLTMVAVVLIEPEHASQKVLRVTLPVGMDVNTSVRIAIDQDQVTEAQYVAWSPIGRVADASIGTDFVDRLKKGRLLLVEGKSLSGSAMSFVMPLSDFAKAYNGPPADPKVFEKKVFEKQQEDRKPWKDDTLDPRVFQKSIQQ